MVPERRPAMFTNDNGTVAKSRKFVPPKIAAPMMQAPASVPRSERWRQRMRYVDRFESELVFVSCEPPDRGDTKPREALRGRPRVDSKGWGRAVEEQVAVQRRATRTKFVDIGVGRAALEG